MHPDFTRASLWLRGMSKDWLSENLSAQQSNESSTLHTPSAATVKAGAIASDVAVARLSERTAGAQPASGQEQYPVGSKFWDDDGVWTMCEDNQWRLGFTVPDIYRACTDTGIYATSEIGVGKKLDAGKAPVFQGFEQYFPRAIKAVANISAFGAKKYNVPYEDQNWSRVDNASGRYRDARNRHHTDEQIDGLYALDSKQLHAAHAAWNSMAYLELLLRSGVNEQQPES